MSEHSNGSSDSSVSSSEKASSSSAATATNSSSQGGEATLPPVSEEGKADVVSDNEEEVPGMTITKTEMGSDPKEFLWAIGIKPEFHSRYEVKTEDFWIDIKNRLVRGLESGLTLEGLGFHSAAIAVMACYDDPKEAVRGLCDSVSVYKCTLPPMKPAEWTLVSFKSKNGTRESLPMYMLNTCLANEEDVPAPPNSKEPAGNYQIWYHGCDLVAMHSILTEGIDVWKGDQSDFSNDGAFYLNPNLTHDTDGAFAWCIKLAEAQSRDDFAIIRFRVNMDALSQHSGKRYEGQSKELDDLIRMSRKPNLRV